jgi:murein DD-endopeptidase MepM/ murein hydrolase activator NlpD
LSIWPNTKRSAGRTRSDVSVASRSRLVQVRAGKLQSHRTGLVLGDTGDLPHGSRLKWFVSTCVAAAIGVGAIGAVLYGSIDSEERIESAGKVDKRPVWERIWDLERLRPAFAGPRPEVREIEQSALKEDRLPQAIGGMVTRHVIHESDRVRKGAREVVVIHAYTRLTGRLSTSPPLNQANIPAFNPYRLYANLEPIDDGSGATGSARGAGDGEFSVKVVELLGGFLPEEDGQELEPDEIAAIVTRSGEELAARNEIRQSFPPEGTETAKSATAMLGAKRSATAPKIQDALDTPPTALAEQATTVLVKSSADGDEETDIEGKEVIVEKVSAGDKLQAILQKAGTEIWQAREIADVANTTFPVAQMKDGHEVRMTLVPSPTNIKRRVPVRVTIVADGATKVTVVRSAAGAYVLEGGGADPEIGTAGSAAGQQLATVYTSLYHTLSRQNVPQEMIELILRTNAYDIDFKRRVRPGDTFEMFFDKKEADQSEDTPPGELLFTSISAAGEEKRFYRYRTPDGVVDYYDLEGNNSKRFLMRKPVRGEEARLSDGFGMRFHPLYRIRKMHTGLDWAAPQGTPILAAGNGVIEEAGRKGGYGNYVRIRHANGYKTAYSHMQRIAPGAAVEARVRQGQIIGYVGSTGDSTGPHLHFEILVNNSFVDPMRIQVPRERRLAGKDLQDFQKERARIDDLMRRPPVSSRIFTDTSPTPGQPARTSSISTSAIGPRVRGK